MPGNRPNQVPVWAVIGENKIWAVTYSERAHQRDRFLFAPMPFAMRCSLSARLCISNTNKHLEQPIASLYVHRTRTDSVLCTPYLYPNLQSMPPRVAPQTLRVPACNTVFAPEFPGKAPPEWYGVGSTTVPSVRKVRKAPIRRAGSSNAPLRVRVIVLEAAALPDGSLIITCT